MKRNNFLDQLVRLASRLSLENQEGLRKVEDSLAKRFMVSVIEERNKAINKYLFLTSLPYIFGSKLPKFKIEEIWPIDCVKCQSVIFRHTMPTGNMKPKYLVCGEAPGVGSGELKGRFDRALVYGPTSIFLRKALLKAGIYYDCWFSNALKCATPDNRPAATQELNNCFPHLSKEIKLLKPDVIIVLGSNLKMHFNGDSEKLKGIKRIDLRHPSYFLYSGKSYKEYAKHIEEGLKYA